MWEVYIAQDSRLSRNVALKILPSYFTRDPSRISRFQQEARSASGLSHPNIMTVYEIAVIDNRHLIAAEYIEGETLRQYMQRAPLSLAGVLDIASQVASALAATHEAGISHRDIKPENIMIRAD